jgi:prepilin-type N-terminal cleavage/methylation domain-containing protein
MKRKRAFTLIELLVVIAIIAILAAILFPVFAKAREKARMSSCTSNLKQLALACLQYVQDYDEHYPGGWCGGGGSTQQLMCMAAIQPYAKNIQIYHCPSDPIMNTCSYLFNSDGMDDQWVGIAGPMGNQNPGRSIAVIPAPAQECMMCDGQVQWNGNPLDLPSGPMQGLNDDQTLAGGETRMSGDGGWYVNLPHHNQNSVVISYLDGHAKTTSGLFNDGGSGNETQNVKNLFPQAVFLDQTNEQQGWW